VVVRNIRPVVGLRPEKVALLVMESVLSVESGRKNGPKHLVRGPIRDNPDPSKRVSAQSAVTGTVVAQQAMQSKESRGIPMREVHLENRQVLALGLPSGMDSQLRDAK
jgi:hypothetical protein